MEEKMFFNGVVKLLVVFTALSIGLGIAATMSPAICAAGWVLGTAISTVGGILYGRQAEGRLAAFGGGAVVGGVSIGVGTLLAYTMGTIPIRGVIAATLVGIVSGAVAGLLGRMVAKSPASARSHDREDRMSDFMRARKALVARILEGDGRASRAQRGAAFENAGLAAPLSTLIDKVARHAYKVTDEDIAAARVSGLSEDQIFEVVVCAAIGEATRQYDTALAALGAVTERSEYASRDPR
jgi:hypothetical protein